MRFVAIGECMVEMAPQVQPDHYRMGFAGDTLNTAWYLRQLIDDNKSVDYFTAIGTDIASDRLMTFLIDAGIGTQHILRRDDRTLGLYLIQLTMGERSFSYWRGQSAARTLAVDPAVLAAAIAGADLVYFSGITLAILPPSDRINLLKTLAYYRISGGQVAFDSNLRPKLWNTTKVMKDWVMRAAAVSDIVLPSHDDEALFFGDKDPSATAQRYANIGVSCVVVKDGLGAVTTLQGGTLAQHAIQAVTKVIDSTAAGDSFNAGFLAEHMDGRPIHEAIASGARLAARVIQSRGALIA
jgi:2-dehydro-3-deoxygluconokinase